MVAEELGSVLGSNALVEVIEDLTNDADIVRMIPEDFDTSVLSDFTLLE